MHSDPILQTAAKEAKASLLLSVQQDSIRATQRAERAEVMLANLARATEAMLGRHILYCGGEDLPFAGETDKKLLEMVRSTLDEVRAPVVAGLPSPEWQWYFAVSEDGPHHGPYDTRAAAIENGRLAHPSEPFLVMEGYNPDVELADWINAEEIISRANAALNLELHGNPRAETVFSVTQEQQDSLTDTILAACQGWQNGMGLRFRTSSVISVRDVSEIMAEDPECL